MGVFVVAMAWGESLSKNALTEEDLSEYWSIRGPFRSKLLGRKQIRGRGYPLLLSPGPSRYPRWWGGGQSMAFGSLMMVMMSLGKGSSVQ